MMPTMMICMCMRCVDVMLMGLLRMVMQLMRCMLCVSSTHMERHTPTHMSYTHVIHWCPVLCWCHIYMYICINHTTHMHYHNCWHTLCCLCVLQSLDCMHLTTPLITCWIDICGWVWCGWSIWWLWHICWLWCEIVRLVMCLLLMHAIDMCTHCTCWWWLWLCMHSAVTHCGWMTVVWYALHCLSCGHPTNTSVVQHNISQPTYDVTPPCYAM